MNSRCALIFFSILYMHILHSSGSNETTQLLANHTTIGSGLTTVSNNYTSKILFGQKNEIKRRTVLIINNGSVSDLRARPHRSKRAKTLLYEERDDQGKKVKTYMMYNLDDVAKFFKLNLETEICDVRCSGDKEEV